MKRFISGLIALSLALGGVAFTEVKDSSLTDYYWYRRTAANTYVDDYSPNSPHTLPSTSCSGTSSICVKGFINSQVASSIMDTTTAQQQQKKTP